MNELRPKPQKLSHFPEKAYYQSYKYSFTLPEPYQGKIFTLSGKALRLSNFIYKARVRVGKTNAIPTSTGKGEPEPQKEELLLVLH